MVRRWPHKHTSGALKASWGAPCHAGGAAGSEELWRHHLGTPASQLSSLPPLRSAQSPLLPKQGFGWDKSKGTVLSPVSAAFWDGFRDPLFSLTFPKVPQEAGQLFTPNTGSRGRGRGQGQGGFPSYWKLKRKTFPE